MPTRLIIEEQAGQVRVLLHREGHIAPDPAGPAEPFEPPLSTQDREDLRWYLEDYLTLPVAVYQERGAAIEAQLPAWGERLFESVFGPGRPGRDAYLKAREAEKWELWIASSSPAFLGLPWELAKDPDPQRPRPLALEVAGISRTLPSAGEAAETPPGEVLRVLMVIARPEGPRDVRYRMIARPLLKALGPVAGEVRLEVLRPPTFARLGERLAEARARGEPFHILHFDGHGSFGREPVGAGGAPLRYTAPQGYLLFETETGARDPIAAEALAPVLSDAKVPLLVVNACRSAMVEGGDTPAAAVATRLLLEGTAAVVAMGYSVYAVAAAEFMAAFYEALFAGDTVSRAVAAGRRQMKKADRRPSPKGPLPLALGGAGLLRAARGRLSPAPPAGAAPGPEPGRGARRPPPRAHGDRRRGSPRRGGPRSHRRALLRPRPRAARAGAGPAPEARDRDPRRRRHRQDRAGQGLREVAPGVRRARPPHLGVLPLLRAGSGQLRPRGSPGVGWPAPVRKRLRAARPRGEA